MSEVIYLRDILQSKKTAKKEKKALVNRPRPKPIKLEKSVESFLVEKKKKEDYK
ncbi:MAG: hypothetical protein LBG20_02610 [Holosporaceae bacterium]|jgi:hypothetical protein|nr:hypothetical protein [Holosporaceae bacterium]